MSRQWLQLSLMAGVLGLIYFGLAHLVFSRLPYTALPDGWLAAWPSRRIGVSAWFELLSIAGAVLAALPVALVIALRANQRRLLLALVVAGPTALWYLVGASQYLSPALHIPGPALVDVAVTFLALFLALPMLVGLFLALRLRLPLAVVR